MKTILCHMDGPLTLNVSNLLPASLHITNSV
jgi:hypothetical protein